jgi:uncharacterized cupredoxin-like copper-binding protein
VADAGYLVGIGAAALAIGALAIAFAPDEHAGMDGMGAAAAGQDEPSAAAALAAPDRTVLVEANDGMRFEPDALEVREGETVAFVVTNTGAAPHELVIGDEAVQAEHEAETAAAGGAMDHGHDGPPYAVAVAPGETATLVYTFDAPGTLLYGCHVPGHYAAGMKGTITVTESGASAQGNGEDHEAMDGQDTSTAMGTVDPAAAGVRIEWASEPAAPRPGQPVALTYRLADAESGETITDLPIDHERPMHLILVSRDLGQFQHIHPELGPDGAYRVETTLPTGGTYLLYDEFKRGDQTVLDRRELVVGEASATGAELAPDPAPKTVRAGEPARFTFGVTQNGQPVTDLEPYLGAAAHVAVVAEDASRFAHAHGEVVGDEHGEGDGGHTADGGHALPAAFGPEIGFEHTFPEPGFYKVWAQFGHQGRVITAPFVVEVR